MESTKKIGILCRVSLVLRWHGITSFLMFGGTD